METVIISNINELVSAILIGTIQGVIIGSIVGTAIGIGISKMLRWI